MDVRKFGNPSGKIIMLLPGNLMGYRQFEDVIPFLEKDFLIYAVSFDGFDGTGKTVYTSAHDQAERLAKFIAENGGFKINVLFAESLGCAVAVLLKAMEQVRIDQLVLSGPEYLNCGIFNNLLIKIMPKIQFRAVIKKEFPSWALKFMGQTEEGMRTMMSRIPDHICLESLRATWDVGLNLYQTDLFVQPDACVACWYGEKEGHMKKAVEKLRTIYPKLTVRCFAGYGHGEIINHPRQLAAELIRFLV